MYNALYGEASCMNALHGERVSLTSTCHTLIASLMDGHTLFLMLRRISGSDLHLGQQGGGLGWWPEQARLVRPCAYTGSLGKRRESQHLWGAAQREDARLPTGRSQNCRTDPHIDLQVSRSRAAGFTMFDSQYSMLRPRRRGERGPLTETAAEYSGYDNEVRPSTDDAG